MTEIISIIIILASALLVFVVYVQNPKGGGLSTDFGAAQQIGGVKKTNDFIDKATWSLAGLVAILSIILTIQTSSTAASSAPTPEAQQTDQPANTGQTGGQTGTPEKP
jgi:preprotein translocase subunit SecG